MKIEGLTLEQLESCAKEARAKLYISEADLRAKAPQYGMANVGSQAFPVQARESCNCCDFSVNPEGIY